MAGLTTHPEVMLLLRFTRASDHGSFLIPWGRKRKDPHTQRKFGLQFAPCGIPFVVHTSPSRFIFGDVIVDEYLVDERMHQPRFRSSRNPRPPVGPSV